MQFTINNIHELYEKNYASHMVANEFQKFSDYKEKYDFCYNMVDFNNSFIAKNNNDIIGTLLFSDYDLFDFIFDYLIKNNLEYKLDDNEMVELTYLNGGIEIFAVILKENYRKSYYILSNFVKEVNKLKCDYVWFQQYETNKKVNYDKKYINIGYFIENNQKINLYIKKL